MVTNNVSKSDEIQQCTGLVFQYDAADDLVKSHLYTDASEQVVDLSPLNPDEKTRRDECVREIDDGMDTFVKVGIHLHTIKSQKLYRDTHHSFEAFCKDKWGFCRFHATRLIKASEVVQNLEKAHQVGAVSLPPTEAAARVIADLAPEEQIRVATKVKEMVGNGKSNAKTFQEAKAKVIPPKATNKPAKAQKAKAMAAVPAANVTPMPTQPALGMVSVELPAQFYKLPKLPSLQECSRWARDLDMIRSDSHKREEMGKLIVNLNKWLPLYAEWEQKFLIPSPAEEKEAA